MNKMKDIEYTNVAKVITEAPRGKIFFLDDFTPCGSYTSIRSQVVRFEQRNILVRVARGIYSRSIDIGECTTPQLLDRIIENYCSHNSIHTYPTGEYLLYKLGFTNRVPHKIELLYSHLYPRKINILGKYKLLIKHHSLEFLDKITQCDIRCFQIAYQMRWRKTYPVSKEYALRELSKRIPKEAIEQYKKWLPQRTYQTLNTFKKETL